jgi:hypothetical protein
MVDVPARTVEVRTQPRSDGYAQCAIYSEGSSVPSPLDGIADLDIATILATDRRELRLLFRQQLRVTLRPIAFCADLRSLDA